MISVINKLPKPRKTLPEHNTKAFDTLENYLLIAHKVVAQHANKIRPGLAAELLSNEDAMSYVAYEIMLADWLYDSTKGRSLEGYRFLRAEWEMRRYCSKKGKMTKHEPLYENVPVKQKEDNGDVEHCQYLLKHSVLTEKERESIELKFFHNMTFMEIASQLNVSFQAVQKTVERALKKLRNTAYAN